MAIRLVPTFGDSAIDVHLDGAAAPGTTAALDPTVHERTDRAVADHWWMASDGDGDE
jgi:hypothetical protein